MPDLTASAVTAWLREHEPAIADDHLIAPIEETPSVQPLLPQLGEALDHALEREPVALSGNLSQDPTRDSMRAVLAQMGTARRLRVLAWLAEAGLPDTHVVLGAILEVDASGSGRALQDSLRSHYRRALMARMFAPERIEQLRRAVLASVLLLAVGHAAIAASTSNSGCAALEQAAADGMSARIKADDQNIQAPQSVTKLTCLSNFFSGTGLDVITNLLDPTTLLSAVEGRICAVAQNAWSSALGSVQCGLTVTGFDLGFGLGSGTFCPRLSVGGNGTPIGNFGLGTNSSGGLYLNGSATPPTGY